MPCSVARADRPKLAVDAVLAAFKVLAPEVDVTLATALGKWGLGHSPVRRQTYYAAIETALAARGDCRMQTLRPQDFKDASRFSTVGDIAKAVAKDLG